MGKIILLCKNKSTRSGSVQPWILLNPASWPVQLTWKRNGSESRYVDWFMGPIHLNGRSVTWRFIRSIFEWNIILGRKKGRRSISDSGQSGHDVGGHPSQFLQDLTLQVKGSREGGVQSNPEPRKKSFKKFKTVKVYWTFYLVSKVEHFGHVCTLYAEKNDFPYIENSVDISIYKKNNKKFYI